MKLLVLYLCLVAMATHVRLQVVIPATSQTSTFTTELMNLRNFLNEILNATNSANDLTYDPAMVLSFLYGSIQNLIKNYEDSQQRAEVTPPEDRTNTTQGLTSGSSTATNSSTAFSNTKTTSSPLPVYNTTVPRPQEQPGRVKVCELPPETGMCRGYFVKFHFDPKAGRCTTFVYGGCGGNDNRFDTEEDCRKRCLV